MAAEEEIKQLTNSPVAELGSVVSSDASCMAAASLTKSPVPLSHPVYKKLSALNGEVNRLTKVEIREQLSKLNLDTRGKKDVLKRRLKTYLKRKNLVKVTGELQSQQFNYLLVIDFEATCDRRTDDGHDKPYPHEIIEFPAVLVDVASAKIIDEFHSYVRPQLNPRLTSFCTELTGITQMMVDQAPVFTQVLADMEAWMETRKLGAKKHKYAIVTDGPWDMSRFMHLQCGFSVIPFPRWARKWINIRKAYCSAYQATRVGIRTMLEGLGLQPIGALHSGIADSRNIARIAMQMLEDSCQLNINERMFPRKIMMLNEAVAASRGERTLGLQKIESSEDEGDEKVFVNVTKWDALSSAEESGGEEESEGEVSVANCGEGQTSTDQMSSGGGLNACKKERQVDDLTCRLGELS